MCLISPLRKEVQTAALECMQPTGIVHLVGSGCQASCLGQVCPVVLREEKSLSKMIQASLPLSGATGPCGAGGQPATPSGSICVHAGGVDTDNHTQPSISTVLRRGDSVITGLSNECLVVLYF